MYIEDDQISIWNQIKMFYTLSVSLSDSQTTHSGICTKVGASLRWGWVNHSASLLGWSSIPTSHTFPTPVFGRKDPFPKKRTKYLWMLVCVYIQSTWCKIYRNTSALETWGKAGSNDGVFKLRLYSFRSGNSIDRVIASGNDPSIKTETQVAGKVWDFYAKTFEVAEIYLNRRHFGWAMSLERSDSSQ